MKPKLLRTAIVVLYPIFSLAFLTNSSVLAQPGSPLVDTSHLVAYYDFYGSFRDSTGTNAEAIPYFAELTDDQYCHPLNAVALTDPAAFLEVAEHPSLNFLDTLSISFRVFIDSLPETETRIISKSDPENPSSGGYWISIYPGESNRDGTEWSFSFTDPSGTVHTYKTEWSLYTNAWVQYSVTFDGNSIILYMGNEPVLIVDQGPLKIKPSDKALLIGNAAGSGFTGKMDDVMFYKRIINEEELYNLGKEYWFVPDESRPSVEVCMGEEVELVSGTSGPFLQHTFYKDGTIIQDGMDSICRILIQTEADRGAYSCLVQNCFESHTQYFDLALVYSGNSLEILNQPRDIQVYENGRISMTLEVSGSSANTNYQWFHNGVKVGRNDYLYKTYAGTATVGYYYCEAVEVCSRLVSDSIRVTLLEKNTYPPVSGDSLQVYYPFEGDLVDATGNTGPALAYSVVPDSGMFGAPDQAMRISGSGSYLEIPDDTHLDLSGAFTLSLSLRVDSIPSTTIPLWVKSGGEGDTLGNYGLFLNPQMQVLFALTTTDGSVYIQTSSRTLKPGSWHVFVAKYDGQEMSSYLDKASLTPLDIGSHELKTDHHSLIIGSRNQDAGHFLVDRFWVSNKALSEEEIYNYINLHLPFPTGGSLTAELCISDSVEFKPEMSGPFLYYTFLRDSIILQEGYDPTCWIKISSEEDFTKYRCEVNNIYYSNGRDLEIEEAYADGDALIYDLTRDKIYFKEADQVEIRFEPSGRTPTMRSEIYHDGELISGDYWNKIIIGSAVAADSGAYYLKLFNGCQTVVSDTIHLIFVNDTITESDFQVMDWDWTGNISGTGDSYFSSICSGEDGSFYLLGHFGGGLRVEGEEAFSSGSDDIFIVKYSEEGAYQWIRFIKGTSFKGKGDLEVDDDGNVYVTGSFQGSIYFGDFELSTGASGSGYLGKYSANGSLLWVKPLGTSKWMNCNNIEINENNSIFLGGNFNESITIGEKTITGSWDEYANVMFVAKLDTAGICQWVNHAVTDIMIFGLSDIELSNSGELLANGTFSATADFGNGISLNAMIEAPFLVKYDNDGLAQWGKTFTNEFGFAESFDVSVDEQGRIFMTGMYLVDMAVDGFSITNGGNKMEEIFLARFNDEGVCTALNSYGSIGDGGDFGICYEPASDTSGYMMGMYGDVLIMGSDTLVADPNAKGGTVSPNLFIARFDEEGNPEALRSAGIIGSRFFGEIHVSEKGRLYMAGLDATLAVKKSSASEVGGSSAFVAFRENGISSSPLREYITVNEQFTVCLGDSILFCNHWYKEDGTYEERIINVSGPDTIYVLQLSTEICTSVSGEDFTSEYLIYPNPVSQTLYVKSKDAETFSFVLYGLNGNRVTEREKEQSSIIDVSQYAPGVYILKLIRPGSVSIHKILVH